MSSPSPAPFGPPATILRVADVRASVGYYVNAVGFTIGRDEGYLGLGDPRLWDPPPSFDARAP